MAEVDNAFCPTGKGGGVDPTCSPKKHSGDVSALPTDLGPSTATVTHRGVQIVVNDLKESWGYRGEVEVIDGKGKRFVRGGREWEEGGNCDLTTGKVTLYSQSMGGEIGTVKHLTSHEFMHGAYEQVTNKYREELERSGTESAPTGSKVKQRMDGSVYPEYISEFPTYSRLERYLTGDNFDKLSKDDGVSEYSKAYWKDYSEGKVSWHIAVHETLSEIAGIHERTGTVEGSKLWKDLYKAVRDEHRMLSGQQKKRKGPGLTTNTSQFTDHVLYLDHEMRPCSPADAVILKYWTITGQTGWGFPMAANNAQTEIDIDNALREWDEAHADLHNDSLIGRVVDAKTFESIEHDRPPQDVTGRLTRRWVDTLEYYQYLIENGDVPGAYQIVDPTTVTLHRLEGSRS